MVRANVNFALIKYWGKKDEQLRLPYQASLSFTVDNLYTDTEVIFDSKLTEDIITINGITNSKMSKRVVDHLNYMRNLYNVKDFAYVNSVNNVPTAAGLASSASAFAALTYAFVSKVKKDESLDELSRIARIGSGSAARSIYGDFVIWNTGDDLTSIAKPLPIKWPEFKMVVCLIEKGIKVASSSEAMAKSVLDLPTYGKWVSESKKDLDNMLIALNNKDIDTVGLIAEKNCNHMHELIEKTGINYRTEKSFEVIKRIENLRLQGVKVYYTMDAGPNIKIMTIENQLPKILDEFKDLETIVCSSGSGVKIISNT